MKLQVTLPIAPYFSLVLLVEYCAYSGITQGVKQEAHQMVKGLLNAVNKTLSHEDAGKLLLRLAVGGLMLFHGLHKLIDGALFTYSWRFDAPGGAVAGVYHGGGLADGWDR